MKGTTKTSSPPNRATSASEFVPVPKAVRQLIPEAQIAAATLGAAQTTSVAPAQIVSAFDHSGIEVAEIGARLRWVRVEHCEDSPFQTREEYDLEPEGHIAGIAESMNRVGQLQPGIARPHPDKHKRDMGWVQLAVAHCRKRAIGHFGGNAGARLPEPNRYRGYLLLLVKPLDDLEMAFIAIEENENRKKPNLIERARGFLRLKKLLDERGKSGTWRAFAESKGITYERLRQLARLLELPEVARKAIAKGGWNEKHGRAILRLKDAPDLQEILLSQLEKQKLSGNEADKRAGELLGKAPKKTRSRESKETQSGAGSSVGTSNSTLALDTAPALDAAADARKLREAASQLTGGDSLDIKLLDAEPDSPNSSHVRKAVSFLDAANNELDRIAEEDADYDMVEIKSAQHHLNEAIGSIRRANRLTESEVASLS